MDGLTYAAFDYPRAEYHDDDEHGRIAPYSDAQCGQLADALGYLIGDGYWQQMARRAQEYVLAEHTWRVRAPYLRGVFAEALGI